MDPEPSCRIVQFHVIRGPDEMVGSRNEGGANLFFFALDSAGNLWRGTASESREPVWSRLTGPLERTGPRTEP